jgi:hypothetical protein
MPLNSSNSDAAPTPNRALRVWDCAANAHSASSTPAPAGRRNRSHFRQPQAGTRYLCPETPIVTLPTGLQRGRHTRAMYLRMGINDCIAADGSGYVELAVKLGTDAAFNASVRARILERNHVLWEDSRVPREFERFFTAALRERGIRIDPD